ncbi:MAG: Coq4 family protein [Sphingobium sp.]
MASRMSGTAEDKDFPTRRDWPTALAAIRRLLGDANDTAQVFRIMRALNVGTARANYLRLIETREGGRIAYERIELAERFSDPDYLRAFPAGSVGAAYAAFLARTGYSAQGLAEISREDDPLRDAAHPYAWFGRRIRDSHDIWHVLTGYRADEPLGEACLVGFSYAQTRGLGWAFIGLASMAKALRLPNGRFGARAIWEGFRRGGKARWLLGEDMDRLLAEPLDAARARLRLGEPVRYLEAGRILAA